MRRVTSPPSAPAPISPLISAYKWLPVVDEDLCTGGAAGVEACGPKSLEILDGVAVLVRPDTCGSGEHCIAPCPSAAIRMAWVPMSGQRTCGQWRAD